MTGLSILTDFCSLNSQLSQFLFLWGTKCTVQNPFYMILTQLLTGLNPYEYRGITLSFPQQHLSVKIHTRWACDTRLRMRRTDIFEHAISILCSHWTVGAWYERMDERNLKRLGAKCRSGANFMNLAPGFFFRNSIPLHERLCPARHKMLLSISTSWSLFFPNVWLCFVNDASHTWLSNPRSWLVKV